MKKDSPFYKMHPGSKEMDSPTAFSGKDQSTMSAFNYGTPLDKHVGGHKTADDFDYTPSMPGVTVAAKSPETIKKQVEKNISGAHEIAGNYKTASPKRKREIQAGKYTSGGSKIPLGTQDIKIYNRLKSK